MTDAQPVPGATVSALDSDLREIATATTNAEASPPGPPRMPPGSVLSRQGRRHLHAPAGATLGPARVGLAFRRPAASTTGVYLHRPSALSPRPARAVQGHHPAGKDGGLTIPAGASVNWRIEKQYGSQEAVAEGAAKLDAEGSWNGQWTPAEGSAVGDFVVRCVLDGTPVGDPAQFKVEEFRNPPFNVICEEAKVESPGESIITVSSQYFHGAPNAGSQVKWTATWVSDSSEGYYNSFTSDDMTRADIYSENIHTPRLMWRKSPGNRSRWQRPCRPALQGPVPRSR